MRLSLEIDFPNIIVQSLSVDVTHFRNDCLTEPRLFVFVKFVGKLNPTLPSSAGQANALCVIIGGRAPLLFLELQMMIILHFRRFVGSDQQPAKQPSPPSLLVMAEPAWNDVQFHHDIYFDDKRYRAQMWNWHKHLIISLMSWWKEMYNNFKG